MAVKLNWLGAAMDRQLQEVIETDNVHILKGFLDDHRNDVTVASPDVVGRCVLQSIRGRSLQCVEYLLGDDKSPGPGIYDYIYYFKL